MSDWGLPGRALVVCAVVAPALAACAVVSVAPAAQPDAGAVTAPVPSVQVTTGVPMPSPPPSASSAPSRTATVNVSGDLLWHNTLWRSAELDAARTGAERFDFEPQLESLRPYVSSADLAICHSEVPFAPAHGPYENYPTFAAPQEIAPALRETGWDICTTASNHSMDQGWEGLVRTVDVHRAAGLLTAGTYRTEEEAHTPVLYETDEGVTIAVVSQTFGLNGLSEPEGREWAVDLLDADEAIVDAAKARQAGADIVAVHMHAGDEYSSDVNAQQRAFAEAVTASPDVDLVFGQHAHVPQPIDKVNDTWVIYGAGNLIAASGPGEPRTYDGYVAQVTFTEQPDGSFEASAAEFAPTRITKLAGGRPARVLLIADELAAGSPLADELEASAARTRATVLSLGVEGLTERR